MKIGITIYKKKGGKLKMKIELTRYQAQQIELALIDREIKLKKIIDAGYFKPLTDDRKIPEELSEIKSFKKAQAITTLLMLEIEQKISEEEEKENQGKITIQDYDKTEDEIRKYYAKLREEEQSKNV